MAGKIDYENMLNPAQLEAVMTTKGPVLVVAGAGSGKTRTLVYRVARLVEDDVPPEEILLLTFTRKASREMLERASALSDPRCRFVSGGTFHSLAHRVLRRHAGLLGYDNAFSIIDRPDMEEVIQSLVPELALPKGSQRMPKRHTLANILSKAANLQAPVAQFMEEEYGQFIEVSSEITRLSGLYHAYKKEHQMMDYDDLILNLRSLLEEQEGVREELGREFRYIMVDEYQDTNLIQADLVKYLGMGHRNVMVVGDDSQSIYSFRGANYRNMFDFSAIFPDAKVVKLEENYRSTQPILTFTNALMDQSEEKYTKCLFTRREGGYKPEVIDTGTEPEQAEFVCRYIREQVHNGRNIHDFAVLFRAGYHAFELEAELLRQGMDYVKYGGFKFLESAHIKDFLAHLRVVVNNDEAVSWLRILRLIKNVGRAKSQALIEWMNAKQMPPGRVGEWPGAGKKDSGIKDLGELLARLTSKSHRPVEAVKRVLEYYAPILKERYDDHPKRQKDLDQLLPMAERYSKLRAFLDDLVLEPPESTAAFEGKKGGEVLTLSTVHSAKGLEWPVVFIIWVMEGRFPAARSYNNPDDLEEERRLMYVASTRAKEHLVLCYPGREAGRARVPYGGVVSPFNKGLSSFIQALPPEAASHRSGRTWAVPGGSADMETEPVRAPSWGRELSGLSQGDRVNHPAFGKGVVARRVGEDKIEVFFSNAGRKLLHLKFTTLEMI